MIGLIFQIIVGISGIWLASRFISGVEFTGSIQTLVWVGSILGLINFFIKPVLKKITLPIRILTLGFFGLIINMGMVWLADVLFSELDIIGILPLFWTTVIIWGLSLILPLFISKK